MILVTSSESNNCYVDTASIDGETALKLRRAPQLQTSPSWMQAGPKNEQKIHAKLTCLRGFVECDLPNEKIGVFNGNLELEKHMFKIRKTKLPTNFRQKSSSTSQKELNAAKICLGDEPAGETSVDGDFAHRRDM